MREEDLFLRAFSLVELALCIIVSCILNISYFYRHSNAAYNDVRKKYVRLAVSSLSSSYAFGDHEYFTVNCTLYFYMN